MRTGFFALLLAVFMLHAAPAEVKLVFKAPNGEILPQLQVRVGLSTGRLRLKTDDKGMIKIRAGHRFAMVSVYAEATGKWVVRANEVNLQPPNRTDTIIVTLDTDPRKGKQ